MIPFHTEISAAADYLRMENIAWLCPFSVAEWKSLRMVTSTAYPSPSQTSLVYTGLGVESIRGEAVRKISLI